MSLIIQALLANLFAFNPTNVSYCTGSYQGVKYSMDFSTKSEINFYLGTKRNVDVGSVKLDLNSETKLYGYEDFLRNAVSIKAQTSEEIYRFGFVKSIVTSATSISPKVYVYALNTKGEKASMTMRCRRQASNE